MRKFADKIVVVTGGGRGIGLAITRRFLKEGATVVVASRQACRANDFDERVLSYALDVTIEAQWEKMTGRIMDRYGRIDGLINNAGVYPSADIDRLSEEEMDKVLAVNLKGPLFGIKHVGRVMKTARKGSIVNIGSMDGVEGANARAAYVASKWGMRGVTRTAAMEYGPYGVRVNMVQPSAMDIAGSVRNRPNYDQVFSQVPLRRVGDPEELAAAVAFLCSDDASYISGAELKVDGGWTAGRYHQRDDVEPDTA
jgi:3alpha(or 20beta)-hydroxysteroid dehydrogenase